jgi:hypothetical protein
MVKVAEELSSKARDTRAHAHAHARHSPSWYARAEATKAGRVAFLAGRQTRSLWRARYACMCMYVRMDFAW